jgi:hypothetical protein
MKKYINIRIAVFLAVLGVLLIGGSLFKLSMNGETLYADGYSPHSWKAISRGMTKDEVFRILGAPLDYTVSWGHRAGEETWTRLLWGKPKRGEGYFACIWFDQSIVARKQVWFDD